MKIDSYEFGRIVVNGAEYQNDIIVFPDRVSPEWWREQGHRVALEDLDEVLEYGPEELIIGQGSPGNMKVPRMVRDELHKNGIKVTAAGTEEAVRRFNEKIDDSRKVAGAFHLTC